jgi:hypothetical protein
VAEGGEHAGAVHYEPLEELRKIITDGSANHLT